VLIDFTADWCVPCREYEHKVFNDPQVVQAAQGFVSLQADLTRTSSPEVKALIEAYNIFGPPTIVFLGPDGQERRDLRLVGFVGPKAFLQQMRQAAGLAGSG
jgi:thiol:disulfide interchange protein DsbD